MIKNIFSKKWVSFGVVLVVLTFVVLFSNTVKSSPLDNVSGFAWEADDADNNGIMDGGLGWLSFNCTNPGSNCLTSNYGVTIDNNGNLVGYAWSPHFGWLKFGGLSGFPTGGYSSENAKVVDVVGAPDEVRGWARFCAGAANPDCTGTVINSSNGGWDGWVSLKGSNYGVLLNDENPGQAPFSGYAWGGNSDSLGNNTVGVGWINFDNQFSPVVYQPIEDAVVTLTVTNPHVAVGGTTTLNWTGVGLVDSPTGCIASGGATESTPGTPNPPWTGTAVSPAGSYTTGALNETGTYTYTITCQPAGPGGDPAVASVNVTVGIVLNLEATPSVAFSPNYETTLDWSVIPADAPLTNCVATADVSGTGWDGPSAIPPFGNELVTVPKNPTNFTLTCDTTSPGITVTDTVSVPRGITPENVSLSNVSCVVGGVTTLSWSTQNVKPGSCTAWADEVGTNWEGPIPTPPAAGSEGGINVTAASPDLQTYRLTCEGSASGNQIVSEIELNNLSCVTTSGKPYYVEN